MLSKIRLILWVCLCVAPLLGQTPPPDARRTVQAALMALGGEARWRAISSLQLEGIGFRNWIEQSERPEGPWITAYEQVSEWRDLTALRVRRSVQQRFMQSPDWAGGVTVVADGVAMMERGERKFPGQPQTVKDTEEQLALAPERVHFTALGAPDLKAEQDTLLFGVSHHVVSFSHQSGTVRLLINAENQLLDAIETVKAYPDDFFLGVWGDTTMRTTLSNWQVVNGVRYPHEFNTDWNGVPYKRFSVTKLKFNEPLAADVLDITPEVRAAFEKARQSQVAIRAWELGQVGMAKRPAQEFTKDVIAFYGVYAVTLVRQPDGIVIIEAPLTGNYSQKVLAEAARRFPGVPVKAVISTGDAWTYIGGLREYVARGIPIYALDLNRPLLERLVKAPFRLTPDTLAQKPRAAKFNFISGKTIIGAGENRLELYPVRGSGGERMMLAYLPQHKILYGSDLVQPGQGGGFFSPQYLSETAAVVAGHQLVVEQVYAMHLPATPWSKVTEALEKTFAQPGEVKPQ